MIVGVPKETKVHEYRVGLVPSSAAELVKEGHKVLVEANAGAGMGASNLDYERVGAQVVTTAEEVFSRADMVVKVKEPQKNEWKLLQKDQILFTYLHLAADFAQAEGLKSSGCAAIAYETVTDDRGGLPLLAPMSEVAGRLSIIEGASQLKSSRGGPGILISGVPGTPPAEVVIIGGGVVGYNAARMAIGMGARVTIFDRSVTRLRFLSEVFGECISTRHSNSQALKEAVDNADLVIGAVLIPGAAAPKLVSGDQLSSMRPGAVLVDVAIDQGGCFETSRATTHDDPTFIIDEVVHYCVANIPGAVPRTSSEALNNVTLPYVLSLAENGLSALEKDIHLARGLNVLGGEIVCEAVLQALGGK